MPRLNSNLQHRRVGESNSSGGLAKHLTFWNLVVGTMGALALKERWDEYKASRKPATSPALGDDPEAAASLLGRAAGVAPPAYRDDPSDEPIRLLSGDPGSRAPSVVPESREPYRRKKGCCVCCGVRLDLFCKALGIIVLLYVVYGTFKLVKWAITPEPTGLEGMPEFSASLGCLDAKYTFGPNGSQNPNGVKYTLPIDKEAPVLQLELARNIPGTVVLAQGDDAATDVQLALKVRTSDAELLSGVSVSTSPGQWGITTPGRSESVACMRYDVELRVPPALRNLTLRSSDAVQVRFAPHASISLARLHVALSARSELNMFLPHADVHADDLVVNLQGGYATGAVALRRTASITGAGVTVTKLDVTVDEVEGEGAPSLVTIAGSDGRGDFKYLNSAHRRINADHSSGGAPLYLRYEGSGLNGPIDIQSRGWSSRGPIQNFVGHTPQNPPYVGSSDGPDKLKIRTPGSVNTWF